MSSSLGQGASQEKFEKSAGPLSGHRRACSRNAIRHQQKSHTYCTISTYSIPFVALAPEAQLAQAYATLRMTWSSSTVRPPCSDLERIRPGPGQTYLEFICHAIHRLSVQGTTQTETYAAPMNHETRPWLAR